MPPPANIPPYIQTDGSNAFAYQTMRVRHPKMLQQLLDNNNYPDAIYGELELLQHDLLNNGPVQMLNLYPAPTPDYLDWANAFLERQERAQRHLTWNSLDWFFAETFMFRSIIDITRWWETRRDPFASMKQAELDSPGLWQMLDSALNLPGGVFERLPALLKLAVWGNRIDLSYAESAALGASGDNDHLLLVDHSQIVRDHLLRAQLAAFPEKNQGIAHIVVDNFGTELAMDLALADALLTGFSDVVILHVKYHPTFVSDATGDDVRYMLHRMANGLHFGAASQAVLAMGERLQAAFEGGRLRLAPHLFWTGPSYLWDMPRALRRVFEESQIVIMKGDANYRRTVGDAIWRPEIPFAEVTAYFPTPLLMLRTLKSDPVIGLPGGKATELDDMTREWRVSGQFGLVQFRA